MNGENIVLVGFMGCGKSTIGKKLAKLFEGYRFVDMDDEIEKKLGMKVAHIFEKLGESEFREMESQLCNELSKAKNCIIATGGGVIKNEQNIRMLKTSGIVIYIKASAEHIYRNIKDDTTRPLLICEDKLERIKELLEERKPLYENSSDFIADVSGLNSKEASALIIGIVERNV